MTNELFESLLYEEEGTMIDFKKEQYRFVKASDDEKSERRAASACNSHQRRTATPICSRSHEASEARAKAWQDLANV